MAKLTFMFLVRNHNLLIKKSVKMYFTLLKKKTNVKVSENFLVISRSALIKQAAAHT